MPCFSRIWLARLAHASKARSSERTRVLSQSKRISVIWGRVEHQLTVLCNGRERSYFRHVCLVWVRTLRDIKMKVGGGGGLTRFAL